jgi:DNA-directed RNA polymerase subunit K/omega
MSDSESDGEEVVLTPVIDKPKKVLDRSCHRSRDILTDAEYSRAIGQRIADLANGARPLVDTSGCKSAEQIAMAEMRGGMNPMIIRREAHGNVEFKQVRQMRVSKPVD